MYLYPYYEDIQMQCFVWDGKALAMQTSRGGFHEGTTKIWTIDQANQEYSFPPAAKWGVLQALAIHGAIANNRTVLDFMDTHSIDEVMEFYRRCASHGLLGKKFKIDLMLIFPKDVVAIRIRRNEMLFAVDEIHNPMAVGSHSSAAMAMVCSGLPVTMAAAAAVLHPQKQNPYSITARKVVAPETEADPTAQWSSTTHWNWNSAPVDYSRAEIQRTCIKHSLGT
jgi:hypothetical protein